jgi:hypothetical protein
LAGEAAAEAIMQFLATALLEVDVVVIALLELLVQQIQAVAVEVLALVLDLLVVQVMH